MTSVNIIKSFQACGTIPFDRNLFDGDDFLPSSVTDCPCPDWASREEVSTLNSICGSYQRKTIHHSCKIVMMFLPINQLELISKTLQNLHLTQVEKEKFSAPHGISSEHFGWHDIITFTTHDRFECQYKSPLYHKKSKWKKDLCKNQKQFSKVILKRKMKSLL